MIKKIFLVSFLVLILLFSFAIAEDEMSSVNNSEPLDINDTVNDTGDIGNQVVNDTESINDTDDGEGEELSIIDYPDIPLILKNQLDSRKAHIKYMAYIKELSMNASIGYITAIEGDTSELIELQEDFQEELDNIKTIFSHDELTEAVTNLNSIIKDFRLESRDQLEKNDGRTMELVNIIQNSMDENRQSIDALESSYWQIRKEKALQTLDQRVGSAQNTINILKQRDYDITAAQEKLDIIKSKKESLRQALLNKDILLVTQVNREILLYSQELRDIVRDLQLTISKEEILENWIYAGERILGRTSEIAEDLEAFELDTSDLEDIQEEASDSLGDAQSAFYTDNIDSTIENLKDFQDNLIDFQEEYNKIIEDEELPENIESVLSSIGSTLEETAETIELDL